MITTFVSQQASKGELCVVIRKQIATIFSSIYLQLQAEQQSIKFRFT